MPAPGDQYRDNRATVNPFAEEQPHINEYTAREIATLQSRLDKQLGPEYISTRPGNGGGKVHYLAAEKVINLANEIFGFNGWSSAIKNVQIDFVDENESTGRINLGLSTIVRVTLRDGTYHEDIGYGHCENTKGKAAAFEKAKKEAATDAMKRALRNFGNVLGNCLYDKDYLQRITKVKVAPSRWDSENLHRHPDYAPVKREAVAEERPPARANSAVQRNISLQSETSEFDEFGGNIFDGAEYSHPDEVHLDESRVADRSAQNAQGVHAQQTNGQRQSIPRTHSMPQMKPTYPQNNASRAPSNLNQTAARMQPPHTPGNPSRAQPMSALVPQNGDGTKSNTSSASSAVESPSKSGPGRPLEEANGPEIQEQPIPQGIPEGFVAARQADILNQPVSSRPANAALAFNPHAESPSIRRTSGVNTGKSVPISRHSLPGANGAASPAGQQYQPQGAASSIAGSISTAVNSVSRAPGTNYINPAADLSRRIGMPPPGGVQNRVGYRPPTAVKRPAMADVTNIPQGGGAIDGKKQKTADLDTPNTFGKEQMLAMADTK